MTTLKELFWTVAPTTHQLLFGDGTGVKIQGASQSLDLIARRHNSELVAMAPDGEKKKQSEFEDIADPDMYMKWVGCLALLSSQLKNLDEDGQAAAITAMQDLVDKYPDQWKLQKVAGGGYCIEPKAQN